VHLVFPDRRFVLVCFRGTFLQFLDSGRSVEVMRRLRIAAQKMDDLSIHFGITLNVDQVVVSVCGIAGGKAL